MEFDSEYIKTMFDPNGIHDSDCLGHDPTKWSLVEGICTKTGGISTSPCMFPAFEMSAEQMIEMGRDPDHVTVRVLMRRYLDVSAAQGYLNIEYNSQESANRALETIFQCTSDDDACHSFCVSDFMRLCINGGGVFYNSLEISRSVFLPWISIVSFEVEESSIRVELKTLGGSDKACAMLAFGTEDYAVSAMNFINFLSPELPMDE